MNHSNSSVFISYSHKNSEWKSRLLAQLAVLERHYLLNVWHDEQIGGGEDWRRRIHQAMAEARVAVVLVCPDAMESDFMLREELPVLQRRAEQGELKVIPLICRACEWRKDPWLASLEARPRLSSGLKTLEELPDADRVLRALATEIAEFLGRSALAELPVRDGPLPSDHVYLEKFPLTRGPGLREEQLIGREQELALLDLAFAQPHTAIVSLVAWGGVGKSMLVQHWLQHLEREGWFGAGRVYAWSFYSQGTKEDRQASEDGFLAHALEWFGVKCEPTLSPWDNGRLLADAVAGDPTLLILDGIEPLQYPPGPMGGQIRAPGVQSLLKHLARRANTSENCGLCLVTTREPLTDLVDFERRPDAAWGSVLRVDLGNLTEEAGAALLHHAGAKRAGAAEIKADDRELLAASREVDGHALTLNLLGRFLARAHSGDVRRRDLVKFEEADRNVQGGTTFKTLAAFENWFAKSGEFGARQLAVLRILGLFDRPADAGCIAALREPPVIVGLTDPLSITSPGKDGKTAIQPVLEEDWNNTISFLREFGLLTVQHTEDAHALSFDCHPLIREHFAEQLKKLNRDAWLSANRRICDQVTTSVETWPSDPIGIEKLAGAALYGCRLGLDQTVLDDLYYRRIRQGTEQFSTRILGAFSATLGLLACLFDSPWSRPSGRLRPRDQLFLMQETSFCLSSIGRVSESLILIRDVFTRDMQNHDTLSATQSANYLVHVLLQNGYIQDAVSISELNVELANGKYRRAFSASSGTSVGGPFIKECDKLEESKPDEMCSVFAHASVGLAMLCLGQWQDALRALKEAEAIHAKLVPTRPLLGQSIGFLYCELLSHNPERNVWLKMAWKVAPDLRVPSSNSAAQFEPTLSQIDERASKTGEWVEEQGLLLETALYRLAKARNAIYRYILKDSSGDRLLPVDATENVLNSLRIVGQINHLPDGLLTRAWLRSLTRDMSGACADLDEAWDIALRGPMRLHMADIHLYRARLFFQEKHYPWKSPADDLAAAEKLINDCGYHRRDEELADAKSVILGGQ